MSSVGWGQVEGLARKDVAEQPQANLRTRQGAQVLGMDTEASSGGSFQFDEAPLIGQCSPIDWQVPHARPAMRVDAGRKVHAGFGSTAIAGPRLTQAAAMDCPSFLQHRNTVLRGKKF